MVMQKSKLIIIVILLSITAFITSYPTSSAHIIDSNRIQYWKNVKDNIEIKFGYKPDKPIIDAFTDLEFSVTNLQTGEHVKDFVARVVVTNGQRLFKFENITVTNG
jgi:recombinational DNA repair protein RecT